MKDLPLDHVRTLLAAVDAGTFEAAARVLHVTPSAVSQRVKALEQQTGRVLLVRSKPIRPTESGTAIVRFARQLSWLEDNARAELGLADDDGAESAGAKPQTLSIAVNADSLSTWFLTALAAFPDLADLPGASGICFELHREDQDHTDDLLRQGLVMAAVSSSPSPVQGCSVRRLGTMRYRASANAVFAERWLPGDRPITESLTEAPVVIFNHKDDLQDGFLRTLGVPASGPRHYVPASDAYLEAIERGLGWGMIPDVQAAEYGRAGLVDIAPEHHVDVPLYWQQWKLAAPGLTALGDAIAEVAARVLEP